MAEVWAKMSHNNIPVEVIRPRNHGRSVEYLYRNIEIITKADFVVAFWDGESTGTAFTIRYCKDRKIPLKVIR